MKTRIIFKSIFLVVLLFLLIGLSIIIFSDNNIYSRDYPIIEGFEIEYDGECKDKEYKIYENDDFKYYIKCDPSIISIKWEFGGSDSLLYALGNNKINIESLESHGMEIITHEK